MNGYPEWTPASEKPKKDCNCIVTTRGSDPDDDGFYVHDAHYLVGGGWYLEGGSERDNITKNVLAWMPLPPAYEPPRFGWHNAKDDPPKREGMYLVQPHAATVDTRWYGDNKWGDREILWWSHIEPTPEGDPRG